MCKKAKDEEKDNMIDSLEMLELDEMIQEGVWLNDDGTINQTWLDDLALLAYIDEVGDDSD